MAKQASVNHIPADGPEAIFLLRNFLRDSLGWVVVAESDGSTYEADVVNNGHQITHAGTGAGGMSNTNAWFRIQDPDGSREWTFQRSTTVTSWRVKASALDGFTGGTPSATATPSATDEQILLGGGTDASPTWGTLFVNVKTWRWHMVGWDVAEDGVWPFIAFATESGGINGLTHIAQHSLDPNSYPALTGTRATPTDGEPDPCIYVCDYDINGGGFNSSTGGWGSYSAPNLPGRGWFAMNGSNGNTESFVGWVAASMNGYSTSRLAPANDSYGPGINVLTGEDQAAPIMMFRDSYYGAPIGPKGTLQHLKWRMVPKYYPSYCDIGGERYVYVDEMLVPFDNTKVPLT